jgi:Putative Ig domain
LASVSRRAFTAGAAAAALAAAGLTSRVRSGLPPGLMLQADGMISGVPVKAGTWKFGVTVTDAAGAAASKTLEITVGR